MNIFLLVLCLVVLQGIRLWPKNEFNRTGYLSHEQTRCVEGIFVILVLFSHYRTGYITPGEMDNVYVGIQKHLDQAIVAMFLFYSGFGMMSGIDRKGRNYVRGIPAKFVKLLFRFDLAVLLFLLWRGLNGTIYTGSEYLLTFAGWKSAGNSNWYIFSILCMYLCMFLGFGLTLNEKKRKSQYIGLVLMSVLALGYLIVMRKAGKEEWWYNTVICFLAGAWYYKLRGYVEKYLMRNETWYVVAFTAIVFAYCVMTLVRGWRLLYYEAWVLLFTALVVTATMKITLESAILDFLGRHVFSIYILQRLVLMVTKDWSILKGHPYIRLILITALTILVSLAFDFLVDKLLRIRVKVKLAPAAEAAQKSVPAAPAPAAQKPAAPAAVQPAPKAKKPAPAPNSGNGMMASVRNSVNRLKKSGFLFSELVKRDFKQKYKRTVLGMWWSVLSPLLTLLVMRMVFTEFFGRNTEHYTTYLFCGNLLFSYFRESTTGGMNALMSNRGIISKINVPKYLFLLSKNVSALINFGLTLCVFFIFAAIDRVTFSFRFITLLYPVFTFVLFNIGVGLILSALFVFFRDIGYLYEIFTLLLMYLSAIFYNISSYGPEIQRLFLLNPIYCHILYFRTVVLDGMVPQLWLHMLCLGYALAALAVGGLIYKKNNHKFLYYM